MIERVASRTPIFDTEDVDRITVTDSPSEAVMLVRDVAMRDFGMTYGPRAKPRWFLGEHAG